MQPRRERALSTPPARKLFVLGLVALGAAVVVVATAAPAMAQAQAPSLAAVIDRLRNLLVGVLAAAATLFLTIGGLRYMAAGGDPGQIERAKMALRAAAGGDPGQIERAKMALRAAAVGYVLAALAPVIVALLSSLVAQ